MDYTGIGVLAIVIFFGAIALYFLPTIVGISRKKKNLAPIVIINLLLGWTIIGWIVALVWALAVEVVDTLPAATYRQQPPSQPPQGKLCSHCGKYSTQTSRFCSNCGQPF